MENDRAFAEILNDCLDAIAAEQVSIQDCLSRYPQHAAQLADLLRLGDAARRLSLPVPTPEMLAAGEHKLVQAAVRSRAVEQHEGRTSRGLLATVQTKLRALPGWVLPVTALSASMAVLFVCAILAVLGGSLVSQRRRGADVMPASPPVVVSEGDPRPTPVPSPTAAKDVAQPVSPLPNPTAAEGVAQHVSPVPGPTAIPGRNGPSPQHTVFLPLFGNSLPPHLAILEEIRGLVEVQSVDGDWAIANDRQILKTGARLRTGALSRASVTFHDGSTAYLGPNTEISIDVLGQDAEDQSRIVELTQWLGETDHDVAPSYGAKGRYEVHTPSGSGAAKGTLFHVSVTAALAAHFRVDQGTVAVTHLDVTVVVVAGQSTIAQPNRPPSKPVFRVTGEGQVEEAGSIWQIAGQRFQTHAATVIVGNPLVGDWVRVDGRLLADGTRVADWIVLLRRAPTSRFTITGEVEAIGALDWTIAGQEIAVDETTVIDEGIQIGDRVRVDGVIDGPEGGTLLAEAIALIDPRGVPFSFVGVAEETAEAYWLVSGISVSLDAETVIDDGPIVGDIVRVRGVFLDADGGTWLARSIRRLVPDEHEFEFVGVVESIDPWLVSGVAIETRMWTEIKGEIQVGDWVNVEGRILPDGTWLAKEIKLVRSDRELSFEFMGRVEHIEPWLVSGISLTVNHRTEIKDEIEVGDRVEVEGRILLGGEWLATEIELVDRGLGRGCMQFTSLVIRVSAVQLLLQNGATVPLDVGVQIQGEIQVNSVILFHLCLGQDSEMAITNIIVIAYIEPVVIVQPTPTPSHQPPSGDGDQHRGDDDDHRGDDQRLVTICHQHQGESGQRETMVIEWTAWINEHSRHGDTLGPCE